MVWLCVVVCGGVWLLVWLVPWLFSVRQEALCDILTFYRGSFVIAPHKTPLKQDHIVLSSSYILRSSLLDIVPNTPNVAQKKLDSWNTRLAES